MDLFFAAARIEAKRRVHFNAFMGDVQARLHAARKSRIEDAIRPVAKALAGEARLLCLDEFQVQDVADAMILGRLFEGLLARKVTIVTTSNTAPERLYEGGLNRQLFLPFIALIAARMDVISLNGATDYRRLAEAGGNFVFPLGPADAALDAAWRRETAGAEGHAVSLDVLGRKLTVTCAAGGVARLSFLALCDTALGAGDYLALARAFHTLILDHIPLFAGQNRDAARRFTLLIDTLYDEGVRLIASAAAAPDDLCRDAEGCDMFRRTASRLNEMRSDTYMSRSRLG